MDAVFAIREQLFRAKYELLGIKAELKFARFSRAAIKAGFNPDQPRDEDGKWTSAGGVQVTTSSGFLTGIPTIDDTSQALSDALIRVMEKLDYLPEMSPQQYGTAVHVAFGIEVGKLGLPGVGDIERSFSLDDSDPRYGLLGTIRTDVVLRNIQGDIIAIYDVKTGDAGMSRSRADKLREKTSAAPNTPVFELNVLRGPSRKYQRLLRDRAAYVVRTHAQLKARRA